MLPSTGDLYRAVRRGGNGFEKPGPEGGKGVAKLQSRGGKGFEKVVGKGSLGFENRQDSVCGHLGKTRDLEWPLAFKQNARNPGESFNNALRLRSDCGSVS